MGVIVVGIIIALVGRWFDVSCICGKAVSATAIFLAVATSGVLVRCMASFGRGLQLQLTATTQAKESNLYNLEGK